MSRYFACPSTRSTDAAADRCAAALDAGSPVALDRVPDARAAAFIITNVEAAELHIENVRTRPDDFSPTVRDRLMSGALMPGHHYVRAQRVRRAFCAQLEAVFAAVDILVAPATPFPAPAIGADTAVLNGEKVMLRPNIGIYTQPIALMGLPVVTVPAGMVDGLPIGVQLIGPPMREDLVLAAAARLEALGVAAITPPKDFV